MSNSPSLTRKQAALRSIVRRKSSLAPERPPVDLAYLVRVYLLDGSSKVLQMKESSVAKDVLDQLKYNMDLCSIKTFALFRVSGLQMKRIELNERIRDTMTLLDGETDVKLLFRSWICDESSSFEKSALQEGVRDKQPNTALWLKYIEATFMVTSGKYYLTEDESILLGCLKMQADSGDYRPSLHTTELLQTRIATSFPLPIKEKMNTLLRIADKNKHNKSSNKLDRGEEFSIAERVKLLYSRLSGYTKSQAQIEYIRSLRVWCPFYNSTFYAIECQYDDKPYDSSNQPPVLQVNIAISPLAIFIVTQSQPPVILRLPYNRIVKYVPHADMNIFMFWSLKDTVQLSDLERQFQKKSEAAAVTAAENEDENEEDQQHPPEQDLGYDPNQFCDCIYFVTEHVKEIQFLFETYYKMLKYQTPPCLPGDVLDDDDHEEELNQFGSFDESSSNNNNDKNNNNQKQKLQCNSPQTEMKRSTIERRSSRLNLFFQALGVNNEDQSSTTEGGGVLEANLIHENETNQQNYSDDAAQVNTSVFTNLYSQQTAASTAGKTSSSSGPTALSYDGIDMLLANSLDELNELSQIDDKKNSSSNENSSSRNPPVEENNNETNNNTSKRKSIFRWG